MSLFDTDIFECIFASNNLNKAFMKKIFTPLFFMVFQLCCLSSFSQTEQRKVITYYERSVEAQTSNFQNILLEEKSKRVSNSKGNIVLIHDELEDSVLTAINVARELWEAKLTTSVPIYMYVVFEPLDKDVAMAAEVSYWDNENEELYGLPTSLVAQIKGLSEYNENYPDFLIILNSELNWNCRFEKTNDLSCNIPTMVMRGIARGLGFGSSIVDFGDGLEYYMGFPTIFDRMLFNTQNHLTDFKQKSQEMLDFVQSDDVKFKTENNQYKIYSPKEYVPDMSLCYIDNDNSLMSHKLSNGDIALSVDDATVDILNSIGWSIPEPTIKIKCNDISTDGIGSSYIEHTFSLNKTDAIVDGCSWEFSLKGKDGNYKIISTGSDPTFTISKITDPNDYYINTNGDIEGRIDCEYKIDGVSYTTPTFAVSLELKPTILSVNEVIKKEDKYKLWLEFTVEYRGADRIDIEIEEEFNSAIRVYRHNEPYIAHIKTDIMNSLCYSWVTLVVSNKYGKA